MKGSLPAEISAIGSVASQKNARGVTVGGRAGLPSRALISSSSAIISSVSSVKEL